MADIRPFRGIRFNSEVAGDLSANLCPTYVLSDEELRALYDGSDYNVIRLELAYDWSTAASNEARYIRSARTRTEWLMAGALKRDPGPCRYVVEGALTDRVASERWYGAGNRGQRRQAGKARHGDVQQHQVAGIANSEAKRFRPVEGDGHHETFGPEERREEVSDERFGVDDDERSGGAVAHTRSVVAICGRV